MIVKNALWELYQPKQPKFAGGSPNGLGDQVIRAGILALLTNPRFPEKRTMGIVKVTELLYIEKDFWMVSVAATSDEDMKFIASVLTGEGFPPEMQMDHRERDGEVVFLIREGSVIQRYVEPDGSYEYTDQHGNIVRGECPQEPLPANGFDYVSAPSEQWVIDIKNGSLERPYRILSNLAQLHSGDPEIWHSKAHAEQFVQRSIRSVVRNWATMRDSDPLKNEFRQYRIRPFEGHEGEVIYNTDTLDDDGNPIPVTFDEKPVVTQEWITEQMTASSTLLWSQAATIEGRSGTIKTFFFPDEDALETANQEEARRAMALKYGLNEPVSASSPVLVETHVLLEDDLLFKQVVLSGKYDASQMSIIRNTLNQIKKIARDVQYVEVRP